MRPQIPEPFQQALIAAAKRFAEAESADKPAKEADKAIRESLDVVIALLTDADLGESCGPLTTAAMLFLKLAQQRGEIRDIIAKLRTTAKDYGIATTTGQWGGAQEALFEHTMSLQDLIEYHGLHDAADPLRGLRQALSDARDLGAESLLFQVTSREAGSKVSNKERTIRIYASATMTLLMQDNALSRKEASQKVANAVVAGGWEFTIKSQGKGCNSPAITVTRWREDISRSRGATERRLETYESYRDCIDVYRERCVLNPDENYLSVQSKLEWLTSMVHSATMLPSTTIRE